MPRGRRSLSLEEQILQVEENIRVTESSLKTLKTRLSELEEKKKKEHLELLYQKIVSSGKTVEEALELLNA